MKNYDELIDIRSIQQYLYCPHRWGLIEIDCSFAENVFVTKGNMVHERVNSGDIFSARGVIHENTVRVYNDEFEIYGVLDCLEFRKNKSGVYIEKCKDNFKLIHRTKRPPLDYTNAMLSFLYTICTNDIASALECVGLDPYIGFYHTLRPGRVSLACDIMEEFRSMVERVVITMINLKQINKDDFEKQISGAVLLNDEGRKKVITHWQNKKREIIMHPFLKEKVPVGLFPYIQANLLAKYVRGELSEYPNLTWR